jgi:hypothetical protein
MSTIMRVPVRFLSTVFVALALGAGTATAQEHETFTSERFAALQAEGAIILLHADHLPRGGAGLVQRGRDQGRGHLRRAERRGGRGHAVSLELAAVPLALVAGVAGILSPCVWPLVPVVTSSAATSGRSGPVYLSMGLALSFAVAGTFLTLLLVSTGLDPELFRYVHWT